MPNTRTNPHTHSDHPSPTTREQRALISAPEYEALLAVTDANQPPGGWSGERACRLRAWSMSLIVTIGNLLSLVPDGALGGVGYPPGPFAHEVEVFFDLQFVVLGAILVLYGLAFCKDWHLREISWLAAGLSGGVLALDASAAWAFLRPLHLPVALMTVTVTSFTLLMARNALCASRLAHGKRTLIGA